MPISLETLIRPEHVVLDLKGPTQDEALREVSALLAQHEGMRDPAKFLADLLAREKSQSTATGDAIAFPHARTDSVEQIMIGVGRSNAGIPYAGTPEPVHLIFVIATPRQMVSDYLIRVGTIARLLKQSDLREDLRRAPTPARFVEIFQAAAATARQGT